MKQKKTVYIVILFSFLASTLFFQNCSRTNFQSLDEKINSLEFSPVEPAGAPLCVAASSTDLAPKLLYSWNENKVNDAYVDYNQVSSIAVVGQIDGDAQSEIIFSAFNKNTWGSFKSGPAVLRALDGKTGSTQFTVGPASLGPDGLTIAPIGATTPVLADLNGDGKKEIVYINSDKKSIVALNGDGTFRWKKQIVPSASDTFIFSFLGVSDVNKNGKSEILFGQTVIEENASNAPDVLFSLYYSSTTPNEGISRTMAASLNPSNPNDISIIDPNFGVSNSAGQLQYLFPVNFKGALAVGDVDPNVPGIEIVSIGNGYIGILNGITGQLIREKNLPLGPAPGRETNGDLKVGGGAPTIGSFDGNPAHVEIAFAIRDKLVIYDKDLNLVSEHATQDDSSVTGITSFDFNGDGKPEIIYADEEYLRIFEMDQNRQLQVVQKIVNPSLSAFEYPVVADVNDDGSAELVVVSNFMYNTALSFYNDPGEASDKALGASTTGVRVFTSTQSNAWMPADATWDQYDFNVSMLNSSGVLQSKTDTTGSLSKIFRINTYRGTNHTNLSCRQN